MSEIVYPDSLDELKAVIESSDAVLPVGSRTKETLSSRTGATLVSLSQLTGILEYQPSEFTFTAWAATPVAEVQGALAAKNQYLPFDPLWVDAGATLGGTVAAGISGPGRIRYGGIRDFILGIRFLSGDGEVINAGGKVVKNAAGFDIPKLLVGSLGRLGVMTELTFKVFPKASSLQTYEISCDTDAMAVERIALAATSRWELDAIDYRPADRSLLLRLAGPRIANDAIATEIGQRMAGALKLLDPDQADALWTSIREMNWYPNADAASLVKVPITLSQFLPFQSQLTKQNGLSTHLSIAGAVLWVAADTPASLANLDNLLRQAGLSGLVVRGESDTIWLGRRDESHMAAAIKNAMDPVGKFPN